MKLENIKHIPCSSYPLFLLQSIQNHSLLFFFWHSLGFYFQPMKCYSCLCCLDISLFPFFFAALEKKLCKIHFVAMFFLQFTCLWRDTVLSVPNLLSTILWLELHLFFSLFIWVIFDVCHRNCKRVVLGLIYHILYSVLGMSWIWGRRGNWGKKKTNILRNYILEWSSLCLSKFQEIYIL